MSDRPRATIRPEFAGHLPYAVAEDQTFRRPYWRYECPCGATGAWVADPERPHDEHKAHVAAQLLRCPDCLEPLTRRHDPEDVTWLACSRHGDVATL
jgi:hypothetical protein